MKILQLHFLFSLIFSTSNKFIYLILLLNILYLSHDYLSAPSNEKPRQPAGGYQHWQSMDPSFDSRNRKRLAAALLQTRFKNIRGNLYQTFPTDQPSLASDKQLTISPTYNQTKEAQKQRFIPSYHSNKKNCDIDRIKDIVKTKPGPFIRRPISTCDDNFDEDAGKPNDINNLNDDEHQVNGTIQAPAVKVDNEICDEIKRRLSLPVETSIPKSFLTKHKNNLIYLKLSKQTLSRAERRKSLYDIGFGKLSSYVKSHVLGSGTYSTVYKGTSRLTKKLVALKEIHIERDEGVPFTAIREVSLLKELKHSNIITLHDIIYANRTLTLVFEYVDRDLSHYLDECDHQINIDNVKIFLYQLLRGLKYCHDRRVLHRDLKPQNILISQAGELKLADFGLARAKSVPTKTFTDEVVTLWYRPPDVLLGNVEYGTSIDMWGVGCIFFEMAAGYTLFTAIDPKKQIECIFEIIGTPNGVEWPSIKSDLESNSIDIPTYEGRDLSSMATRLDESGIDLLAHLLKCNPKSRISSRDAINHTYFGSLPIEIHELDDSQSIFTLPTVKLAKELCIGSMHNIRA